MWCLSRKVCYFRALTMYNWRSGLFHSCAWHPHDALPILLCPLHCISFFCWFKGTIYSLINMNRF